MSKAIYCDLWLTIAVCIVLVVAVLVSAVLLGEAEMNFLVRLMGT